MTTQDKFNAAVNVIRSLPKDGPYQPSHDMMLKFYGLYKQATEGQCSEPKPAFYEVVKGYKWRAWNKLGDLTKQQAMSTYVDELKKVLETHWQDYCTDINQKRQTNPKLTNSHAPVQEIVETMSYTENVASFIDALGPFYEYVDFPGLKKDDDHLTNNNIIKVKKPNDDQNDSNDTDDPDDPDSLYISDNVNDVKNSEFISNGHSTEVLSDCIGEIETSGYHEDGSLSEDRSISDLTLEHYSTSSMLTDDAESACEGHITRDTFYSVTVESPSLNNLCEPMMNGHGIRGHRRLMSDTESDEEYSEPAEIPELMLQETGDGFIDKRNMIKMSNGVAKPESSDNEHDERTTRIFGLPQISNLGGGDQSYPAGLHMTNQQTPCKQYGSRNGKSSSRNSVASGGSPGHSGNGGFGGRGGPGGGGGPNGGRRQPYPDLNAQLVMVLNQIQSDMTSILSRLNTLEAATIQQCSHGCHCQNRVVTPSPEKSWWPFPELSPRSTFFLLTWPLILHGGVKLLILLRSRRRHRT